MAIGILFAVLDQSYNPLILYTIIKTREHSKPQRTNLTMTDSFSIDPFRVCRLFLSDRGAYRGAFYPHL